jgi:uncharacterized delta-60 repeat protein
VRVALDAQGRAIVTSSKAASSEIAVRRVKPDGEIDASFSYDGNPPGIAGSTGFPMNLAVASSDKLVVVSRYTDGTPANVQGVVQLFDANAAPDTTWKPGGRRLLLPVQAFPSALTLYRVLVDAQGRFVLGGNSCPGTIPPTCLAVLARLTPQGDDDATFGASGVAQLDFGDQPDRQGIHDIALDRSGQIVGVGTNNFSSRGIVLRLNGADGTPDTTFGPMGRREVDLGNGSQRFMAVAIDTAGRIVVVGRSNDDISRTDGGTVVNRLRFDGAGNRDASFGSAIVRGAAIDPRAALTADDQLVVASGVYRNGASGPIDVAVHRFWP